MFGAIFGHDYAVLDILENELNIQEIENQLNSLMQASEPDCTESEIAQIIGDTEKQKEAEIDAELGTMRWEITQSEKGQSVLVQSEKSYEYTHRAFIRSTFPTWFKEAGFSASKDFFNCIDKGLGKAKKRPTKRFERLRGVAIDRLKNGYANNHGYNKPSELFTEIPF